MLANSKITRTDIIGVLLHQVAIATILIVSRARAREKL